LASEIVVAGRQAQGSSVGRSSADGSCLVENSVVESSPVVAAVESCVVEEGNSVVAAVESFVAEEEGSSAEGSAAGSYVVVEVENSAEGSSGVGTAAVGRSVAVNFVLGDPAAKTSLEGSPLAYRPREEKPAPGIYSKKDEQAVVIRRKCRSSPTS
jgi:hypothetical protein